MWKSHLRIAWRALARQRLFTTINLVGLAVGMAACTLIALWTLTETRHDRWVPDGERVFVAASKVQYPGRDPEQWRHASAALWPVLKEDFRAQVEAGSRVLPSRRAVRIGQRVENQAMILVDPGFFDALPWPVLHGSTADALSAPGKLVVTERFVRHWFGSAPAALPAAVGQVLSVTVKGDRRPFEIVAVLRDLPPHTIFDFDAVALFDPQDVSNPGLLGWGAFTSLTVVKLKHAGDAQALAAGADDFIERHVPDFSKVDNGFYYRPSLLPMAQAHLHPFSVTGPGKPPGNPTLVATVAITGLLVLVIAIVTYINLATARVSLREREVGLRKTLGASRGQLIAQFLVESMLLAAAAGLLALALVELGLPLFNQLLGQHLVLRYGGSEGVLWPLVAMVLLVGLAGGWYPALVMAGLKPRQALSNRHAAGGGWFRQALVVGQFAVAIGLGCAVAVMLSQIGHLARADMGYEPRGLVLVQQIQRAEVKAQQNSLLDALRRVPGVQSATASMFDPTGSGLARQPIYRPGVPDAQAPQISVQPVDWDFVATYGARLIAGRDLSRDRAGDDASSLSEAELARRGVQVLINRSALSFFNTRDPAAAVGQGFQLPQDQGGRYGATVVGVLEDVRIRSARDAALPSFYARDPETATSISVRVDPAVPEAEMLQRLEAAWRSLLPDSPFNAKSVHEVIDEYYATERRLGSVFALFAGLAIALCAMGLYGLAVFTAERRTREIGLRKLMGARVADILRLLAWQYAKPVLLALAVAWPLAAWAMQRWLEGFETRVPLTPTPFLVAGLLALMVAWITVGAHALKVARLRPSEALRQE
jgi:putative ABC transport system permease protein